MQLEAGKAKGNQNCEGEMYELYARGFFKVFIIFFLCVAFVGAGWCVYNLQTLWFIYVFTLFALACVCYCTIFSSGFRSLVCYIFRFFPFVHTHIDTYTQKTDMYFYKINSFSPAERSSSSASSVAVVAVVRVKKEAMEEEEGTAFAFPFLMALLCLLLLPLAAPPPPPPPFPATFL